MPITSKAACAPFTPFVMRHGPPAVPVTVAVLQFVVKAATMADCTVAAEALKGIAAVVCVAAVSVIVNVPAVGSPAIVPMATCTKAADSSTSTYGTDWFPVGFINRICRVSVSP